MTAVLVAAFHAATASAWQTAEDTAAANRPPTLSADTVDRWRDYILPDETETVWRAIPWRESYWQAVMDAHAERKPVLLWTMNGHPLGCT